MFTDLPGSSKRYFDHGARVVGKPVCPGWGSGGPGLLVGRPFGGILEYGTPAPGGGIDVVCAHGAAMPTAPPGAGIFPEMGTLGWLAI